MAVKLVNSVAPKVHEIEAAKPAPGAKTAFYKLGGAYWDGVSEHRIDDVLEFEVGKAPRSAKQVPEPEYVPPARASVQDDE